MFKKSTLAIMLLFLVCSCQSGFVQEDIDNLKKDIKTEFEKREGVRVTDVQIIKESPKKLSGFVKLTISVFGQSTEVTKSCTATMGDDNKYIWKCD